MTQEIIITLIAILFSGFIGLVGYWLKSVYAEFKLLLKELMDYTNKLEQLIVGIQIHIDKAIEEDIREIKTDIKTLYQRTNKHDNQLAALSK
ncbi:MAG TPA: hypothetical protein DIU39_05430 [Flavobacteriales bacterium]|jgi:predicted PurR-regulated permease PerM|nr:MAG: hypothetical protein D6707_10305 [Bacteroidota bacterium]HCQ29707.1 hypothetical protein [Flavobacteriales bacterium]|tara:strand:- start:67 stop:342 length:276 start_codon:yes stop_codon:yes gene_type:complete